MSVRETEMLPAGFMWNQALAGEELFQEAMLTLITIANDGSVVLLGTAFVVSVTGNTAYAWTCAHLFDEIAKIQNPNLPHHPSTPAMFRSEVRSVDLGRQRVRAVLLTPPTAARMLLVDHVTWDAYSDVAVFRVRPENENEPCFGRGLGVTTDLPKKDDIVCMLALDELKVRAESRDGDHHRFEFQQTLVMRCGRVTEILKSGHTICPGPAVETTIPLAPGMSGSPVFALPEVGKQVLVFGIASHDPTRAASDAEKRDYRVAGQSVVSLLPITRVKQLDTGHEIVVEMRQGRSAIREDPGPE